MSSRLVILDANIIIAAFEHDFWNSLVDQYKIHVNSVVLRQEVYHYYDKYGQKTPINLQQYIDSGKIVEVTATMEQISNLGIPH
jgi:hypothetical protein